MEFKGILLSTLILITGNVLCKSNLVDRRCLNCFCLAQSNCNMSAECINMPFTVCGPYKLSRGYWIDGGKLGGQLENDDSNKEREDFERCSKNKACAEQTIENYMKLYTRDCNENDIVDCVDYFRIHVGGPGGCKKHGFESGLEWLRFLECYLNTATNVNEALINLGIARLD
ncbi:lysozyme-like [Centruroides vittatus]|uniref:lysozyme-like n=1 Tax=Centruroides vittatus TaxID=120091 RepID=UPI0035101FFF